MWQRSVIFLCHFTSALLCRRQAGETASPPLGLLPNRFEEQEEQVEQVELGNMMLITPVQESFMTVEVPQRPAIYHYLVVLITLLICNILQYFSIFFFNGFRLT